MQPNHNVDINLTPKEKNEGNNQNSAPQKSNSLSMAQSLVQFELNASRAANPILSGLSGIGGNFMSLALKDAKDELRVTKKAEQLTKDKLTEVTKKLDQSTDQFTKYKQDSEVRIDTLRTENSMLSLRLQHMHDQNEALERSSSQSQQTSNNNDMIKIVEEYSKSSEAKSKEIESLLYKQLQKKQKSTTLKSQHKEIDLKFQRLQSKLENMTKFCSIFIKSIKVHNLSLQETVRGQQQEVISMFKLNSEHVSQQVSAKFQQLTKQFESTLNLEQQKVLKLTNQLEHNQSSVNAQQQQKSSQQVIDLERDLLQVRSKCDKYKKKIAVLLETQSGQDITEHQSEVHRLELQSLKQKQELHLQERDNLITTLKESIEKHTLRETNLHRKLDTVDSSSRQDYQKLVELHEGSSRYREIRDLYEDKLSKRDQSLMETKESLIKAEVRLEFQTIDLMKGKQSESRLEASILELEKQLKNAEVKNVGKKSEIERIKIMQNESELKISKMESQISELKQSHQLEIQTFDEQLKNSNKIHSENIQEQLTRKESELSEIQAQFDQDLKQFKIESSDKVSELHKKLQIVENDFKEVKEAENMAIQTIKSLTVVNEAKIEEVVQLRVDMQELKNDLQEKCQLLAEQSKPQVDTPAPVVNYDTSKVEALEKELFDLHNQLLLAKRLSEVKPTPPPQVIKVDVIDNQCQTYKVQSVDVSIQSSNYQQVTTLSLNKMDDCDQNIIMNQTTPIIKRIIKSPAITTPLQAQQPQQTRAPQQQAQQIKVQQRPPQQKTQPMFMAPPIVDEKPVVIPEPKLVEPQKVFEMLAPQIQKIEPAIKPKVIEEETKIEPAKPTKAQPAQPQAQGQQPTGGIFGIFSSFMSILSAKKQGYTGKPATAMYYCDKKKRWIIDGEDDSGDDVPPPPPPKARPQEDTVQTIEKPQESEVSTGLGSLTAVGFSGALANRNRGNRSKSQKPLTNFPQPSQPAPQQDPAPAKPESPIQQQEMSFEQQSQFDTTRIMDQTDLNMTTYTANESLSTTQIMQNLHVSQDQEEQLRAREQEWKQKYSQQNERIQSLRDKVNNLQEALKSEKLQTSQTINELESFSQEMQSAGNLHHEQLTQMQSQIGQSKEQLQLCEMWKWQAEDNLRQSESELDQVRLESRSLKQRLFSVELDSQIKEMNQQMMVDDLQATLLANQTNLSECDHLVDANESLRWQLSLEQQTLFKSQKQLHQCLTDNNSFKQKLDQLKSEAIRNQREFLERADRDKEYQLRDLQQRANQDKDHLKELHRKSLQDMQAQLKRLENDKLLKSQEHQRQIQEKDQQHYHLFEQSDQQHLQEITQISLKLDQQTSLLQSKIQSEKGQIKKQLISLESVLNKKDEDLQAVLGKNEEVMQELDQMSDMRHKLNDHIVYLQNEIRKRDELLEGDSDFEDDFGGDDSSTGQISNQDQSVVNSHSRNNQGKQKKTSVSTQILNEAREKISALLEGKIQLKREVSILNQQLGNLQNGLEQIHSLFGTQQQLQLQGQDDLVEAVIQKYFDIQNQHDSQLIQLKHQIDILKMAQDEAQNLKFDIQLLNSERDMISQDLSETQNDLDDLRGEMAESKAKINESTQDHATKLQMLTNAQNQKLSKLKSDSESQQLEHESTVQNLRVKLSQKEDQISQITGRKKHMQIDLDHNLAQIKDLTTKLSLMNHKFTETCSQHEVIMEEITQDKELVESQLHQSQRHEKELQQTLQISEDQIINKDKSLNLQAQKLQELTDEFDNVAQAFIQKKSVYKQQIQKLKESQGSDDPEVVLELKAQLSQADSLIQQMQSETERVVIRLQEKREGKESKLKNKINELENEISAIQSSTILQEQIQKLRNQYSEETSKLQLIISKLEEQKKELELEITNEVKQKQIQRSDVDAGDELTQLKELIQTHKQSYSELKQNHDILQDSHATLNQTNSVLTQDYQVLQQTNVGLLANETELKQQLTELESQLNQTSEIESQYQDESSKLAQLFKTKQAEYKEKNSNLKSEFRSLLDQYQQLEQTSQNQIQSLQTQLQSIQQEKLNLSQSLDLTKIQTTQDQSRFLKQLESEHEVELNKQLQTLVDLLKLYDSAACDFTNFEQCIELLAHLLRNANEDKLTVTQLVQERDELQHEVDGLIYKLQFVAQERDQVKRVLSEAGDRGKMVEKVGRLEEDRNDFIIKFDSMSQELNNRSQELSVMKEKLHKYETKGEEKDTPSVINKSQEALPAAQRSFFSSLFLTPSDLK